MAAKPKSPKPRRYAIGEGFGGSNALSGPNPYIDEWEWVHTGPHFAAAHPLGRLRGAMLLVIGYTCAYVGVAAVLVTTGDGIALVAMLFGVWTLHGLIRKRPRAYWQIWAVCITSLPYSLPLIVYWAEGTRPNLIYQHRFERLVPRKEPR